MGLVGDADLVGDEGLVWEVGLVWDEAVAGLSGGSSDLPLGVGLLKAGEVSVGARKYSNR